MLGHERKIMKNKMVYRAFVFDDESAIRSLLWSILDHRGYEVFTFPHPGVCPQFGMAACPCPLEKACTDIIISDLNMPVSNGLDFVEEQVKKGCHCRHMALMSGDWKEQDLAAAKNLGFKIFSKPFQLNELINWLDDVEKKIVPRRKLSNWWKENYSPPEGDNDV